MACDRAVTLLAPSGAGVAQWQSSGSLSGEDMKGLIEHMQLFLDFVILFMLETCAVFSIQLGYGRYDTDTGWKVRGL